MLRITGIAIAIGLVAAVVAPQAARAWSLQPMQTNQDGSSKFVDPDSRLDHMAGNSAGSAGPSSGFSSRSDSGGGGSGWSFSMTRQPEAGMTPFGSMLAPGWPNQGR